jgi:hypothetical protein
LYFSVGVEDDPVPRRFVSRLANVAGCGALIWLGAQSTALAQSSPSISLFSPSLTTNQSLFQPFNPGFGVRPLDQPSLFGNLPPFGSLPSAGAGAGAGIGSTGFDSTNAGRRRLRGRAALLAGKKELRRTTTAPVPLALRPGVNLPATIMTMPQRLIRRGGPDPQTTSLQNVPTTIATVRPKPPPSTVEAYTPLGIRAGTFVLRPAIEVSGGYDSNPTRINRLPGSSLLTVTPELQVRSNWSRHALNADLRGSYTWYRQSYRDPAGGELGTPENISRPNADARINGRLDVTRLSHFDGEGRVIIYTDNPGSPNVQADLKRFPIVADLGSTLGYTQAFNRLEVTTKAAFDGILYQPSTFINGVTESNDDRNYNQYAGSLRVGYELKPGLRPFVEGGTDARIRELQYDDFGYERSSRALYGKVGSTFEFSRKIAGEVALGYTTRRYQDPRLPNLEGMTIDGSLIWTATALTTLTLTATTLTNEIVTPNVSGDISRDVIFRIDHAFRRWLIATGRLGYGFDDYIGSNQVNQRYLASFALLYKLNRDVQLKGEIRHDWQRSNVPGNSWDSTSILFGMRLQR